LTRSLSILARIGSNIAIQFLKTSRRCEASSSQASEEATRVAEGSAVAAAREARASGIIQKVERPLKPGFEYTLRRVDHHHSRRATDYTSGENQSMINQNDDHYEWTSELHDHRFWSHFQKDWYLSVIKDRKNPITPQLYVDWSYMQQKCDPVFIKVIAKVQTLGSLTFLGCVRTGTLSWLLNFVPLLGEVEMAMSPQSTSALRIIDSVFVSRCFLLSSDWPPLTSIGQKLSLRGQ
jgi:hypothetical protein